MSYTKKLPQALLVLVAIFSFVLNVEAQQKDVDSSVYDRLTELEKQVAQHKPGEEHFLIVGLLTTGFVSNKTTTTSGGTSSSAKTNSFPDVDHFEFSPMFLWRHGQKFLLEFEPSFDGSSLGVNWADVSWFAAPGLIIRGGYLVLPFGTYSKRLAAGWIDKLPTDPAGVADIPGADFGVEIEGGLPLGNMKWNYDVSLTNGMQLLPDGELQNVGSIDNNRNKTLTGRIGFLPFSNSSLEIGLSGLYGTAGDDNTSFKTAKTTMYAVDVNYVQLFNPIAVNFKGQFDDVHVNEQTYVDTANNSYTFNNNSTTYFAQLSLRPSGIANAFKNVELAFRVGNYTTPNGSLWGNKSDYVEGCLSYWLSWRTVFKCGVQSNTTTSTAPVDKGTKTKSNSLFLQFSIQL
jgi:hypothetical protein